ncbi:MAG TPA: amidohydrolase [Actinomycetota bacterium]|nr:amidohydrolase [Actinomycetota bacterium]
MRRPTVVADGGTVTYAGSSARAPAADETVEVDGFLMPGVADRHVHIRLADPGAVLLGGVTAVRDLAWPPDEIFSLAAASELPSFTGPLIRAAGPMLTAPGGYPTADRWAPEGTGYELVGPDHAAWAVGQFADLGAAAIKVSLNAVAGPTPSDAELAAIVEAAHARDLPVTAHVEGSGQAERALGAGIDEFAHVPWTDRLPDPFLEAAAKTMRMVSTLDIQSFGDVTPELRTASDNAVRFLAVGGTIVYGTDLGNGPIPPGIDVREALLLHEALRMPVEDVLTAMVAGPLAEGAPADLIALARDPFQDLHALGDLPLVVRAGRVVARR